MMEKVSESGSAARGAPPTAREGPRRSLPLRRRSLCLRQPSLHSEATGMGMRTDTVVRGRSRFRSEVIALRNSGREAYGLICAL